MAALFQKAKEPARHVRQLFGHSVAGATLPVLAFLLLGIYGRVIWLILCALVSGCRPHRHPLAAPQSAVSGRPVRFLLFL